MYVRPRPRFRPRNAGGVPFSPALLFTSGVAGAWYDPSDYSTLFQDSAGTTPVTAVEQPVGLMLDKSQGLVLGSELVTNGDFSGGTTGWTKGADWTIASGAATLNTTAINQTLYQTFSGITAGKVYSVSLTVTSMTSGSLQIGIGTVTVGDCKTITAAGTYQFVLRCGALADFFRVVNLSNAITVATVDNISVRELPGNHASQATAASRPVLRARYNQLTYSEQFDNAAWAKTNVTLTANAIAAPDGTLTADNAAISAATAVTSVNSNAGVAVSVGTFTVSCYVKANGVQYASVGFIYSSGIYSATQFDLTNGTVVRTASASYTSPSATITPLSNGWYRCTHTATVTTTTIFPFVSPSNALWTAGEPRQSLTGNGTDGIYIWGADLRTGSSAGTYQRIAAATDYATAGFLPYLAGDGVDDQMSSNSINLTGTDKLTAVFGTLSNSTANQGVLQFGSGAGTMNALYLTSSTLDMRSSLQGSTGNSQMRIAGSGPGVANVYSQLYDIAGATAADESQIRVNGTLPTQNVQSAGPAGGGNFSSSALTIFQFSATFFLNGRIYQMVFCGKTLSASELASTEAYVNARTGAY